MKLFKRIVITGIIVLSNIFLNSQERPFELVRIITDYRGVVTNGKKTICYGDYGIMTFTVDAGKTWEQKNFNEKHNVLRIETDGKEFYGVTDYILFRSYADDSYMMVTTLSDEPKVIDMALFENYIYILTRDGILCSDKEMNYYRLLTLDSNKKYSELKTDGNNLFFILDEKLLLKYHLSTQKMDTIDLIKEFNCYNCTKVSEIKIFDDSIFVQISEKAADGYFYYSLLKSDDGGKNWIQITNHNIRGKSYSLFDNDIYFLKAEPKIDSNNSFFYVNFSKIDSSHYQVDSSCFTQINNEDGIERYIRWRKDTEFNDFVMINKDTIIAVGNNNLIAVSYNNGKSFKLKSFFNAISNGYHYQNVRFVSDSLIYVINGFEFFKSENAGITWLPQRYYNYNNDSYSNYPDYYYIDKNGIGFANYRQINSKDDSSSLITSDFGEHFTKTNSQDLIIPFYYGLPNSHLNREGLDLGDVILFTLNPEIDSKGNKSFLILRYDKSLKLLDTTRYLGHLRNLNMINENNIIALFLVTNGENKADSDGNTTDYSYHYYLRKSTDKGKTWDSIEKNIPIRQKLLKNGENFYYDDVILDNALVFGNFIVYPTSDNVIYRYDYINERLDSLLLPITLHRFNSFALFGSSTKIFLTSNNVSSNKLFYTDIFSKELGKWDSIPPELLMNRWENYDYFKRLENKDAILSAHMFNDSVGFLVIGKTQKDISGYIEYKLSFAKIRFYNIVNVEDYKIENNDVYFWHSNPYPLPGQYIIKSNIHWTRNTPIHDAKIDVFDINGTKIKVDDINIEPSDPYSGKLVWDCSNINSGIYIIQISLFGKSINFPVVVTK
jgi:hypothetical protein